MVIAERLRRKGRDRRVCKPLLKGALEFRIQARRNGRLEVLSRCWIAEAFANIVAMRAEAADVRAVFLAKFVECGVDIGKRPGCITDTEFGLG